MSLRHVVLDFDGTCTLVEATQDAFLTAYHGLLTAEVRLAAQGGLGEVVGPAFAARWDEALAWVREGSPTLGWSVLSKVSGAPAWADPYIASGEAVAWLERRWHEAGGAPVIIPHDLYKRAYDAHPAPWRAELPAVLEALVGMGLVVTFVSNSATATIAARLDTLLGAESALRKGIRVFGHAAKFIVKEPEPDRPLHDGRPLSPAAWTRFSKLPAAVDGARKLGRPVLLRRGDYYRALLAVWGDDGESARHTLVAGDIFELDLAMPLALGGHAYLVERAPPFDTQGYERKLVKAAGGAIAPDLTRLPAVAEALVGKRKKRG